MNNLQYIVKNDTRTAMHVAVELCEQGDFDSVTEAVRWLMRERDDAATLGGGRLTAEQVREAVMSADRWEKPMGNTGLTNTHLIIRDDGWQAIADELNTALDGGECAPRACRACGAGFRPRFARQRTCDACLGR